jgi:hypothetical protein
MIALWVFASPADVESYAATLLLPSYLAHLQLQGVQFSTQAVHRTGREPLVLQYRGAGRLEEYRLEPQPHALGLIRFLCPQAQSARLQLPQDDANWFWPPPGESQQTMRIYFSPAASVLGQSRDRPAASEAYVSVSRGHVFIGPDILQAYLDAWLRHLGLPVEPLELQCDSASGGIEFSTQRLGGQLFVDTVAMAEDLLRFAGLAPALADVEAVARLDLQQPHDGRCGVFPDGLYLPLICNKEPVP